MAAISELKLQRALPISINDNFQPSGLMLVGDHLLTVSDKHDNAIFEIVLGEDDARLKPYRKFRAPRLHGFLKGLVGANDLDLEGITSDGAGGFLLASEEQERILHVPASKPAEWLAPLAATSHRFGLCTKYNAKLEGITRLSGGEVLLAVERDPRGLMELSRADQSKAEMWEMNASRFAMPHERRPDFSDLTEVDGRVFALLRSAHLVVQLERTPHGWSEGAAWSFADTENQREYAYLDQTYGMAEGLGIGPDKVYVVLDNNGQGRAAAPSDTRPLLFVFKRPDVRSRP